MRFALGNQHISVMSHKLLKAHVVLLSGAILVEELWLHENSWLDVVAMTQAV